MSSGSYATKAGFREDLKPNGVPVCVTADAEPRGPEHMLSGLCVTCGRTTVHRNAAGHPQHLPGPQLPACAVCGEPMRAYYPGQVAHPSCEPAS